MDKIKFKVHASTNRVGSGTYTTIEIDKEDLEGIPEDEWEDHVWDELGGVEAFWNIANGCCERCE